MSKKWTPKRSKKNNVEKVGSYTLYTFIYLHVPSYTPEYLYIHSYTPIYIKISNIRKMRSDIRPKNCLKWGKGVPHGQNLACTLLPYCQSFFYTQRTPIWIRLRVFEGFGGVIQMHNPVNRAPYSVIVQAIPNHQCSRQFWGGELPTKL